MERKAHLLIVDDDADIQNLLSVFYQSRGFKVSTASSPLKALAEFPWDKPQEVEIDVILTDFKMDDLNGVEFVQKIKALHPFIPIILMTAHGSVDLAQEAMEAGAFDFVVKPIHFPQLTLSINRALKFLKLTQENTDLKSQISQQKGLNHVVFKSQQMREVLDLVKRISRSQATVLIQGETGSGKEMVAKLIHELSSRAQMPFVAVNCSAIPETLLESEFFGHAKGAYTGAVDKRIGLFEEAQGGVLFLDEIGDLPLALQAKLLRVLQEKKVKRVGENQYRNVDVRVIAATHRNLIEEVRDGHFREDLYFRLNVVPVQVPPLRDRKEDIILLANSFLKKFSSLNHSPARRFSPEVIDYLTSHQWPGNVRQLENVIEYAVVICDEVEVNLRHLPKETNFQKKEVPRVLDSIDHVFELFPAEPDKLPTLEEIERLYVNYVISVTNGAKEKAAKILNIDRKTLYRKLVSISGSGAANQSNGSSQVTNLPSSPSIPQTH